MKVIVSTAVSSDGYLDDRSPDRLILSTPEDWAEVHRLRAACDAILVGAETIRRDNPSLLVGRRSSSSGTNRPGASVQPGQGNADRFVPALAGGQFLHPGRSGKDRLHHLPRSRSPAAGGDSDSRRRDHGCSDRYRTRKTGTSLPAGRRRSCDAPDVLRRKSGRYLPAGCQSGRKSGGSPGTPFGDRFRLSANASFDRIVGRNAGHDLCDQARPDRRRPPLPANGDRRKPQMYPIDLFLLCRCSDCND